MKKMSASSTVILALSAFSLIFNITGCSTFTEQPLTTTEQIIPTSSWETTPSTQVTTTAATSVPTVPYISPDTVGIYIPAGDGTNARTRITEFVSIRTPKKDIDCFEIFSSQQPRLTGTSFSSMWKQVWAEHEGTEGAKIGFHIAFSLSNGQYISEQLLKPSDSLSFFDYLEIYMYDDIHQTPGVWYTHLEDKDITENTIISSIKLTSGSKISEVGDITLTAFLYQGDQCFDAEGQYLGSVLERISIRTAQ